METIEKKRVSPCQTLKLRGGTPIICKYWNLSGFKLKMSLWTISNGYLDWSDLLKWPERVPCGIQTDGIFLISTSPSTPKNLSPSRTRLAKTEQAALKFKELVYS